jgi:hypothetical protein
MVYPIIYNQLGEWIGFVTPERDVYDIRGNYVGWLSDDPRILRKRTYNFDKPRLKFQRPRMKEKPAAHFPLPPLMAELPYDTIDVLEEEPERLYTMDSGELRPDLD